MRRFRTPRRRRIYARYDTPETKIVDKGKGIYEVKVGGLLHMVQFRLNKEDIKKLPYLAFQGGILSKLPGIGDGIYTQSKPVAFVNPAVYPLRDEREFLDSLLSPGSNSVVKCMEHAAGQSFNAALREKFVRLDESDYPAILVATLDANFQRIETAAKLAPGNEEMLDILETTRGHSGNDAAQMSRLEYVFTRESQISLLKKILAQLEKLAEQGVQV